MGNKAPNVRVSHKNIGKRSWPLALIGILVMIVLFIIVCSGCSTKSTRELDVTQFLKAEFDGYNGYGSADLKIDYDLLIQNIKVDDSVAVEAINVATEFPPYEISFDNNRYLSNGDYLNVVLTRNEDNVKAIEKMLNVVFVESTPTVKVYNLEPLKKYNPFSDMNINTNNSIHGYGQAEFEIRSSIIDGVSWKVKHDGENGKLKNGDVVKLEIADELDIDTFVRNTGCLIEKTTMEYKIHELNYHATDGELLNVAQEYGIQEFEKVINEWVVSGLNDASSKSPNRSYANAGYIYYTNNDLIDKDDVVTNPTEGILIGIYEVEDENIPDSYFVFIGLKGVFSYGEDEIFLNDGEDIPDSFIYYEKETVRYDYDRGWPKGDELMGFEYNGNGYAGHQKMEETVAYIFSTYGQNYKYRYASGRVIEAIEEYLQKQ